MPAFKAAFVALALGLSMPAAASIEPDRNQQIDERNDIVSVSEEDKRMNAAIAEARRTLPEFLALLQKRGSQLPNAGIKFPLGGWEHIWVNEIRRDGDVVVGKLGNAPIQEEWQLGDEVRVPVSEISDWAWRNADGVMQGHHTTRALLDMLPSDEAKAVKEALGW
jgi:uncharacterized protein YegJ (DUF2314 family)